MKIARGSFRSPAGSIRAWGLLSHGRLDYEQETLRLAVRVRHGRSHPWRALVLGPRASAIGWPSGLHPNDGSVVFGRPAV